MEEKSCCFIGHRDIEETDELIARLTDEIEKLIGQGVRRFIFGSRSDFDSLCYDIVTDLREKYPDIVRVCYDTAHESSVLEKDRIEMEKTYSQLFKKEYHLFTYEEIYKPKVMYKSGKASYVERNQIMIDKSDHCIFYYDPDYMPRQKLITKRSVGGCGQAKTAERGSLINTRSVRRKTL